MSDAPAMPIEAAAPPPERRPAREIEPAGATIDSALTRLEGLIVRTGAIAGAAAATVAFVAVVGGAVTWLRFRQAELPADQAVALVPRGELIVVGLRLMVLPVVAAGILSLTYIRWQRPRLAEHERRRADGHLRRHGRSTPLSAMSAVVVALLVLSVPFTPGALAWPVAAFFLLAYHRRLCVRCASGDAAGVPLGRLAIAAMVAAAVVSIARQLDPPVLLHSATVRTAGETVSGTLVTANADTVAVSQTNSRSIRIFRRSDVQGLVIGPPLDQRAPAGSLLSRMIGGATWAATPLDVWCGGERYAWWRLPALCRTQPRINADLRETGAGVVARLKCPKAARDGCAGFLTMETIKAFSAEGKRQPVLIGRKAFTMQAGARGDFLVRIDRDVRRVLAAGAGEQPRGEPVAVEVRAIVTRDLAGEAPVPGATTRDVVEVEPPKDAENRDQEDKEDKEDEEDGSGGATSQQDDETGGGEGSGADGGQGDGTSEGEGQGAGTSSGEGVETGDGQDDGTNGEQGDGETGSAGPGTEDESATQDPATPEATPAPELGIDPPGVPPSGDAVIGEGPA